MNDEIAWTITKNRKMLGDDVFYVYKTKEMAESNTYPDERVVKIKIIEVKEEIDK